MDWKSCVTTGMMALAASGCADLAARKVPLQARLEERDLKTKGFRYYLPRPHFVVTEPITVSYHAQVGTLGYIAPATANPATGEAHPAVPREVYLAVPRGNGTWDYLNCRGEPVLVDQKQFHPVEPTAMNSLNLMPDAPQLASNLPVTIRLTALEGGLRPAFDKPLAAQPSSKEESHSPESMAGDLFGRRSTETPEQDLSSKVKVVMLPDFEQQIAIDDRNFAAKSAYSLKFHQGWGLTGVNGDFDATDVPVKALQTLSAALSASAGASADQRERRGLLSRNGPSSEEKSLTNLNLNQPAPKNAVRGVLVQHQYIPPGIYKMLRADEAGCQPEGGLLAELGLPTESAVTIHVLKSEQ